MLVAFSDLHLSDEKTAVNVHPSAFTRTMKKLIMVNRDKDRDNSNTQIKEIIIVLLGDIFDFVRTDYWLDEDKINVSERPWNGTIDKESGMNSGSKNLEKHFTNVLEDIFNTGSSKAFFDTLNFIKTDSNIPVKIVYVIGNHDRILNNYISLQNKIAAKFGDYAYKTAGKKDEIVFVNEYMNKDYAVFCRHGHEWDEDNYGFELHNLLNLKNKQKDSKFDNSNNSYISVNKIQSIGEMITSELMSGIIYRLKGKVKKNFLDTLKNLNNVRPMTDAFNWLFWYGSSMKSNQSGDRNLLFKEFKNSLVSVLNSGLSERWSKTEVFDITAYLNGLLLFIKNLDFNNASDFVNATNSIKKIKNKFKNPKDSLLNGAKDDFSKINSSNNDNKKIKPDNRIQYILYGHTHEARNDYFDGFIDGSVEMYINTGTFLPYIQMTKNDTFASAHQMTMVFIYMRDEDTEDNIVNKNPTLDLWNGIKRKEYIVK